MNRDKKAIIFIVLLFCLLFFMRFIHLGADPPPDLSQRSLGFMSDPGSNVFNARNKVVLGKWEVDMWNLRFISPLPNFLTYAVFILFGPGVWQMNFIPALFSCFVLILTYLILLKGFGRTFAIFGTLVLGINYQFTMFSRIAVRVTPQLFFTFLAILLLIGNKEKKISVFFSGMSCFLAFTVKQTFVQIFPAILFGYAFYLFFKHQKKIKAVLKPVLILFLGIATMFMTWLLFIFFPNKSIFQEYGGENIDWLTPSLNLAKTLERFWNRQLFYFNELPIMTFLAGFFLLVLVYRIFTKPDKIPLIDWICSLWMISNIVYFSVIYYQASRHFVLVIPPIVILGVRSLYDFLKNGRINRPEKPPLLFFPFLFSWLIFPLSVLYIVILRARPAEEMRQSKFFLLLFISAALTAAVFILLKFWPRKLKFSINQKLKIGMVAALLMFSTYIQLKPYMNWVQNPRFDIKNISQDLGKTFDKMNIAGLITPVLSLENQHEVHAYRHNYINPYSDFLQRFNITHIFITTHAGGEEKNEYDQDFPKEMRQAKLLARYPLWKTFAELYSLFPFPDEQILLELEGERCYGENGIPRFDPNASQKMAFLADRSNKGFYLEIPDLELSLGNYQAICLIKGVAIPNKDIPVLKIDVVDTRRKRVLSFKNLSSRDFAKNNTYQKISFPFYVNRSGNLTIRIYSTGKMKFWLDKINLIPRK